MKIFNQTILKNDSKDATHQHCKVGPSFLCGTEQPVLNRGCTMKTTTQSNIHLGNFGPGFVLIL